MVKEVGADSSRLRKKVEDPWKEVRSLNWGTFKPARYCIENNIVLLPWFSDEGRQRLIESRFNHAFFHLAHNYQPQKNPFYSGVASMVTVLNALRLDKGIIPSQEEFHYHHYDPESGQIRQIPYRIYTQLTLLDQQTESVKKRVDVAPKNVHDRPPGTPFDPGLTIQQAQKILEIYKTIAKLHAPIDDQETGIHMFRDMIKETLLEDKKYVICNFEGRILGIETGGHFSVVGAYHRKTDSVLLLDSAAHTIPWYWVPIEHLYYAMNTREKGEKRGYLVVKDTVTTVDELHFSEKDHPA